MAAFTAIAAAVVAVGSQAYSGAMQADAGKQAGRLAGRAFEKQSQLEQEAVATLEQNFYDEVRVQTDIYDKAIQASQVQGSQILEAATEGDQRGVSATAGKIAQIQGQGLSALSDKFAKQKTVIDMARAEAGEKSASEIAALQDNRAAAAGLQGKQLIEQEAKLKGDATASFVKAGVSAFQALTPAFKKGKQGKAVESLMDGGMPEQEALDYVTNSNFNSSDLRQIKQTGKKLVLNSTNIFQGEGLDTDFSSFGVNPNDPGTKTDLLKWYEDYQKQLQEQNIG